MNTSKAGQSALCCHS